MPFDIYGNNLRNGYCEVHPYVHEEYPCSMCYMENERNSRHAQPHPDPYLDALVDCCKATLLFHSGLEWTTENSKIWEVLVGNNDVTTKSLCDAIRSVIGKFPASTESKTSQEQPS